MMDWKFKKERVATVSVRSPALTMLPLCCGATGSNMQFTPALQQTLSFEWQGRPSQKAKEVIGRGEGLGEDSLGRVSKLPSSGSSKGESQFPPKRGGRNTLPPWVKCSAWIVVAFL